MLTHEERIALGMREIDRGMRQMDRLLQAIERAYVEEWQRVQLDEDPEYVFEIERRLAEVIAAQSDDLAVQ